MTRKFPKVSLTITLRDQETEGNYVFSPGKMAMTQRFRSFFEEATESHPGYKLMAEAVAVNLLGMIKQRYGISADYLQVFDCTYDDKAQKIYVIHDGEHVTIMLAEEY